jgi:hypothetical protein
MARGRKSAAALEALLQDASMTSAPAQHGSIRELAEKILCCLDRALAALHGEGAFDDDATGGCPTPSKKRTSPATGATEQGRTKRRYRNHLIFLDARRVRQHNRVVSQLLDHHSIAGRVQQGPSCRPEWRGAARRRTGSSGGNMGRRRSSTASTQGQYACSLQEFLKKKIYG